MSKEKKENLGDLKNPFQSFSLIKGEFSTPEGESSEDVIDDESDIKTGDTALVEEELQDLDEETKKLEKGNKVLEETIKKTKEALDKKKKLEEPTTEEEEEDEDSEPEGKQKTEELGYKSTILALYEKGILDVDAEKVEDNEDAFDGAIDQTVKARIGKEVDTWPEDFKKMLNFVQNGGDPKQFLEIYYGNHSWLEFKVESEDAQIAAIKEDLRLAGESPEDIEEIVTGWVDNGSLEKRAKSALVKLQKNESLQKEELIKTQNEYNEKQKVAQKDYWETFKKDIYTREDIKGFKITPKMKDNLWQFMTVVDRKTGKTEYEKFTESDKDSALLFAYFALNKFDIDKLEKQVDTKVTKKYASIFKNYQKSGKEKISGGSTEEHINDNPFSAFKSK